MSEALHNSGKHSASKEAIAIGYRVKELLETPLTGSHDLERLERTNAYILQDSPQESTPAAITWNGSVTVRLEHNYGLIGRTFNMVYASERSVIRNQIAAFLFDFRPRDLKLLTLKDVALKVENLLALLVYARLFVRGNEITSRLFVRQLLRDGGFDLRWEQISATPIDRDRLRIGCAKAITLIILPSLTAPERDIKKAIMSLERYEESPTLAILVSQALRPYRSFPA
jgi:hypothetical protein